MSNAKQAYGTLLKVNTSGSIYTTIAEVMEGPSGPNISTEDIDVTSHDSASGFMEFIPGMSDGGDVGFKLNFNPGLATHSGSSGSGALSYALNKDVKAWKIVYPTTALDTWTFNGYINKFSPTSDPKGVLEADVTIKISGKPVMTTGG